MTDSRRLDSRALATALQEARTHTLAATFDLDDDAWRMPYHPGVQPTAWDLAHIGWFAELWMLRGPHRLGIDGHVAAEQPERRFAPDAVYDSVRIGHRARWEVPLPTREELRDRLAGQLDDCVAAVLAGGDDDQVLYHARFALFHELMHVEALAWTRGILGHAAPPGVLLPQLPPPAQIAVGGGVHRIGRAPDEPGFAFDNELPGRRIELAPFAIDATPVRNAEFAQFVAADGYRRPEFWPGPAGAWLARAQRTLPERWRRGPDGGFEQRWFDCWLPLAPDAPVIHVNAWEAEAYCRFVGHRLPGAAEWEVAAPALHWGRSVWEWTADPFAPYPGFRPAPYVTYSAPWFHHQRELRGGAFATHPLMHDRRYRNFFLPQRTDVFAGFRTAADA